MPRSVLIFALLALLGARIAHADEPRILAATPNTLEIAAAPTDAAPNALKMWVHTPSGTLRLTLEPAQAFARMLAPQIAAVRRGQTRFYDGHVIGQPGSWVRLTRIGTEWSGAIRSGDDLWLIDPASQHPVLAGRMGARAGEALVFRDTDIIGIDRVDFGAVLPPFAATPSARLNRPATVQLDTPQALGITLVLDTEFQQQYGSSAESVAAAALHVADGFYSAQLNTHLLVYAIQSLASNGSLTSTDSGALLDAFSAYSSAGLPFSGLAHLLSGKNFDGSTIGLAWLGSPQTNFVPTLCDSQWGTGVDQATFSIAYNGSLLAHEMGHNFGASHDGDGNSCPSSGYIMEPSLHGATAFSTCSLTAINAYLDARQPACLTPFNDVIFQNDFE
ncbi:MAG TPA: M12 family metallo-peptidase [Rhodanobacteraceae bacterium]|nr:M12 family metallo-peptidase [Rhodanobacteraceae bacterium]